MESFLANTNDVLDAVNGILWHEWALIVVLAVGVLFTLWSGFCQYRALTHGVAITLGKYDDKHDPGAINHFQALSAALSATVGIGNIGGVALAVALGGPGAVFWMWVVGLVGMTLKTTEVTLAMLYRNVEDPDNPHGGAMWVADKGLARMGLAPLGKIVAAIFCVTLLISTITGGNMFQAWNVAEQTAQNFPVPRLVCGVVLAILCALVIIGGIKRIGTVAGALVPFMCIAYLLAALAILGNHLGEIPDLLALIVRSAFAPAEAQQAFLGGSLGAAFVWGLKRAFFSSEAGQGSSPIAHCAARTDEPVREGLVAGLEPFIDTLVVCTITSLVILASGTWNRGPEAILSELPAVVRTEGAWTLEEIPPPPKNQGEWQVNDEVFLVVEADRNSATNNNLHRITGTVVEKEGQPGLVIKWGKHSKGKPTLNELGLYGDYKGAALTSHAFDREFPGLGKYLVTAAVWLFALSTIISWSYYGEQGVIYLFGQRGVLSYRILYCIFLCVATAGFIRTEQELDNLSALGTGVMLFANLPICLLFGRQTMRAYWDYFGRLKQNSNHPT
jgi:AGCS family alanine or glycine:cation symporter